MRYATLMVNLQLGRSNTGLLQATADLAERCQARVVGIAARQPLQMIYADPYASADVFEQDLMNIARDIELAEAEFRAALRDRVEVLAWRAPKGYERLSDYLANEARCADLVLTAVAAGGTPGASRSVNTGDLVMQIGRPVLIVPEATTQLKLDRVLIAWKDMRETRRAVSDALPMLKRASDVQVVEVALPDDMAAAQRHVADVVAWLGQHQVKAHGVAVPSTGDDAHALHAAIEGDSADIIVAGAYGHSRLREWVLGGVTRNLLLSEGRCAFLSH